MEHAREVGDVVGDDVGGRERLVPSPELPVNFHEGCEQA